MQYYIKDLPDLEDEAINAVYDLCEDQVSQVSVFCMRLIFKKLTNFQLFVGSDQGLRSHRQCFQSTAKVGEEECRCVGTTTPKR